jgi:ubiquinone/menaquinone biosynthesis C-methylase UbiE
MPQSYSRVKEVFDQWSMYNAVVQADYMAHNELVATLANWAGKQTTPLRIVDLGCGDAWLATRAFRDANVAQYRGVDVSDLSVERARSNTAFWQGGAEVVAGNLADYLHGLPAASANVVLASYSLHHYLSDAKATIIADCIRVLAPGGTFLWIDPMCHEGESRNAYVVRLTDVMRRDWTALTPDQRDQACSHVLASDFPETSQWMLETTAAAGFTRRTLVLQCDFFSGWAFAERRDPANTSWRLHSAQTTH